MPLPVVSGERSLGSGPEVVLVGGANMDIVASAPVALRPGDSNPGQIACAPGGVARNVAENLARLECRVALVSLVGNDVFGQTLCQATEAAGVDIRAVARSATQRTASYLSLHGVDGDMSVAINDMAIVEDLTPDFLASHADLLRCADCLVLDCNLSVDALRYLMEKVAVAHGIPVFVEGVSVVKCRRAVAWLDQIHTLKLNRLEAQALSGCSAGTVQEATLAARELHRLGAHRVVLSLGNEGVCWCNADGQTGHCPAQRVPVVNTSGAGDALLAGLVYGHLQAWPLGQAVDFAMACAEMTLSSPQANHPLLSLAAVQARRVGIRSTAQ